MTHGMLHVTHDMCHLTHDGGWIFSENVSSLAPMVWECRCFDYFKERDHLAKLSLNDLMTKVFVEQPPATLGLLKT